MLRIGVWHLYQRATAEVRKLRWRMSAAYTGMHGKVVDKQRSSISLERTGRSSMTCDSRVYAKACRDGGWLLTNDGCDEMSNRTLASSG
jgi:hypothetical protein